MNRQADLLEVVGALHPPGSFSGRLNRRKQKANQDGDDRNHHQKLHEGETSRFAKVPSVRWVSSVGAHGEQPLVGSRMVAVL
jgi:hypothetical protein